MNHDSLPTKRLVLANLSLVLISKRQETAIISITIKKSVTNNPEAIAGVMFRNNLLLVDGVSS